MIMMMMMMMMMMMKKINVFVLFSCFLLSFFLLNFKLNCKVPILGGNYDELVSILPRMDTVVLLLLLLVTKFYFA